MAYAFIYLVVFGLSAGTQYVIGESTNTCAVLNGTYDLSPLQGVWPVIDPMYLEHRFEINLCEPLKYKSSEKSECEHSSVCVTFNNSASNLGNYVSSPVAFKNPGGFSLFFQSGKVCKNKVARSNIQFSCGTHLGSPRLMMFNECVAYFEWKSFVACEISPKLKEVPCYVYDNHQNKIDLTPLIKQEGGYTLSMINEQEQHQTLVINVCSEVSKDSTSEKCNGSFAACRISENSTTSYGISKGLQYTGKEIVLEYGTNPLHPIGTRIIFQCPGRLRDRPPHILYTGVYYNEVYWPTEYACPETMLKGDIKTCTFTEESHGVHIDLSSLRIEGGYNVTGFVNGSSDPLNFTVNVCGPVICGAGNGFSSKRITACMYNSTGNSTQVIGTKINHDLRYADSSLTLMYESTSICEGGMKVTTVIDFICDKDSKHNLTHVYSDACMHKFEWKTDHACVKTPSEIPCTAMNGNRIIDLGRLSLGKDQSWIVHGKETEQFFMNICKPYAAKCKSGASFCKIDENGNNLNLGQFTSTPIYNSQTGYVTLEYKNGSPCNGNSSSRWSSSIYFKCKPGHIEGLPFVKNVDEVNCHYDIEWHNAVACPLESFSRPGCNVYNEALGIDLDLSSLKYSVYKDERSGYEYHLSICGAFANSSCAKNDPSANIGACKISKKDNDSQADIIGEATDVLQYRNGIISLVYQYKDESSVITFICDEQAVLGRLIFRARVTETYVFHLYTNLVCDQNVVEGCTVRNPRNNKVYDLTSLGRSDENWVVYYDDIGVIKKSYINICKPLVPVPNCDRSASSCIVSFSNRTEQPLIRNTGTWISRPELASDGNLQLQYKHGDPCVAFGVPTSYTTVIHFLCADTLFHEESLTYLGTVGKCTYTYLWRTHAACPTRDIIVKDQCYLEARNIDFMFDLSSLRNDTVPYSVTVGNDTYQLNICGPVKGGCMEPNNTVAATNVSVCVMPHESHSAVALAVLDSHYLHYSSKLDLQLVYKHRNKSRPGFLNEVIVRFPCSNNSASPPELKFLQKEGHRYLFEMKTYLTCTPKPFTCEFQDGKGYAYSLSSLRKYGSNWIAGDTRPGMEHIRYHVSFCQQLKRISTYQCSGLGIAACQIDTSGETNLGINLGTQLDAPIVNEDGVVTVVYRDGTECPSIGVKRSTRINIFCSRTEGSLTFVEETVECEYIFSLNSPAGCPLHMEFGSDCVVIDPTYGHAFDLTPLRDSNSSVVVHGDYQYTLSVCKAIDNAPGECRGAAACQTKVKEEKFSKNLGLPDSTLLYNSGVITLKYESGSGQCHDKFNRSTLITFTCDHNATTMGEGPSFIAESGDCSYLFEWPTTLACPPFETIECSVLDEEGRLYDLSPLTLTSSNYYVKNPYVQNGTFVINVCRSIVHTPESLCAYTAAACMINPNEARFSKRTFNLGQAERSPTIMGGKLRMKYTSGSHCDNFASSSLFMETVIEFICDEKSLFSQPEFIGQDECVYYFDWRTAYACPYKESVSNHDCTASDPITGQTFDLNPLKANAPYSVLKKNHLFYLSVCEPLNNSSCSPQSGVCQEEIGGGKRKFNAGASNSELQLTDGLLYLNYSGGTPCHGGKFQRSTIIQFHCGHGLGQPEFLYESSECSYYFAWETKLACGFMVHCAVENGTDHIDLSQLSQSVVLNGESALASDTAKYYIRICGPVGNIPNVKCPPTSSICRVSENGTSESLGTVQMAPIFGFNGLPTIIFVNGSDCGIPGEKKRSRMEFICDPEEDLGAPVLVDYIEEYCTYVFSWRTSIVCPSHPTEILPPQSCTYKDVGKGINFDLSSFHRDTYYEVKSSAGTYLLNVCGNVNSKFEGCAGSSVCFQNKSAVTSYGSTSSQTFTYDSKRLMLLLSNGSDCVFGSNGKRSTQIIFVCDPFAINTSPTLYKEFTCSAVFLWKTNLVCHNMDRPCSLYIGREFYDLFPLSSVSHNWNVTDTKGNTYFLNFCRGILLSGEASGCSHLASVCMRDTSGSHSTLGMLSTMKVEKKGPSSLSITYESFNPAACTTLPSSAKLNATTEIVISCGKSLGSPKLISGPDESCNYGFIWETSLACSGESGEEIYVGKDGMLFETDLNYTMDLNPILHRTFEVTSSSYSDNYTYLINFDGVFKNYDGSVKKDCENAAICQSKPGTSFFRDIGSVGTMKFYKTGSHLSLTVTSIQSKCRRQSTRSVKTVINLVCSTAGEKLGAPVFLFESGGCDYLFEWGTYAVCPEFHRPDTNKSPDGQPDAEGHVHDTSSSSSHKAAIVISFLVIACIACYVIFVLSKAERRTAMASKFRVCFSRVTIPQFRYKRWPGESISLVDDLSKNTSCGLTEDENNLL